MTDRPTDRPTDWQADLIKALQSANLAQTGEGLTTQEIADILGCRQDSADNVIRNLYRSGHITCCRKYIINRVGTRSLVPAYRYKE